MANVATLTAKMVMDVAGFMSGANKAIGTVNQLKGSMAAGAAGGLAMAGSMAVLNAGLSILTATANAAKSALMWGAELAADQEQAQVAFTTLLHSGTAATAMLKDLEKFATATPFDFPQVRTAAKTMMAMGIAAKDVQPSLKTLGEIASGVGVPLEQLSMVFGQVKSAGRLMTQDMNQFTSAGVQLPKALAAELGIATTAVRKFVETGKVDFRTFQNALVRLAETDFAGGMVAQSKTALGALSTLKDQAGGIFKDIATGLGERIGVTEWINDFAGFLGYIREEWTPGLTGAFITLGNDLINAFEPVRIMLAQTLRSIAMVDRFVTSSLKGTVSEGAFGNGEVAFAADMGAAQLESGYIREQLARAQAGMKAVAKPIDPGEGLKKSFDPFADALKGFNRLFVGSGTKGTMRAVGNVFEDLGFAGGRVADKFRSRGGAQPQQSTGALVAGSSEAFSAIIRAMTGRDKEETAKKSLKTLEAIEAALSVTKDAIVKAITDGGAGVVNAFPG